MKLLLLLLIAAMTIALVPVSAAPTNTAIAAVHECRTGSCARALASGDVARGALRIDVASNSALGLSQVRLEAIGPGDPAWSCITQVSAGGVQQYRSSFDWASSRWPFPGPASGCTEDQPHKHGEATLNGSFSLRVIATEQTSNAKQTSAPFAVRLDNPSQSPIWRGKPSVDGAAVILRWYRNPEPDVIEYRLVRTDASGRKTVIALDSSDPARTSGCEREREATFTCTDHPPSGRVRYSIQAFRTSPGSHPNCVTRRVRCIGSVASPTETVSVAATGGTPKPSATSSPAASPTATKSAAPPPSTPTVHPTPTIASSDAPVALAPEDDTSRAAPIAGAALALAGLLAAHALYLGRPRIPDGSSRVGR